MLEIIAFIVVFIVGIVVGSWITNLYHQIMIKMVLQDMGFDNRDKLKQLSDRLLADLKAKDPEAYDKFVAAQEAKGRTIPDTAAVKIRLEQHQGAIFAYREDNSEFVGQGTDQQTLVDSIAHRLRGVTIEITNGELLTKTN